MRRIVLSMLLALASVVVLAAPVVIDVPPCDGDASEVLREAVEKARQLNGKAVEIRLQPATYNLYASTSQAHKYHVSNTTTEKDNPDAIKHIGLWLKDMKNVTIDGGGSTLMMHGEMTCFVVDGCKNIKLKNLKIDFADPTVAEMTVEEVDGDSFTARPHPKSKYEVKEGKVEWQGYGWAFSDGIAQAYDPDRIVTWRVNSPQSTYVSEVEPGLLRFQHYSGEVVPGYVFQMRTGIRKEVCGFIHRSKDVKLQGLKVYFTGNFGVVGQFSENISLKNCWFGPSDGRTCAGFADFVQMSGCKGKVLIEQCAFAGSHDDPVNVHGTHLKIVDMPARNQLVVRFMHPESYGFDAFFPGDEIRFVNPESLLYVASAKVKSAERLSDYDIRLTLTEPEHESVEIGMAVENYTWTPEVTIRQCLFTATPTRGVLVTTPRKVCIEDNNFWFTTMSAILIADDAMSWYESGPVRDVKIRRNTFVECGEPVILIQPENLRHDGAVHKNIKITDNDFLLKGSAAVSAKSTDGLILKNNTFETDGQALSESDLIQIKDCSNVSISL